MSFSLSSPPSLAQQVEQLKQENEYLSERNAALKSSVSAQERKIDELTVKLINTLDYSDFMRKALPTAAGAPQDNMPAGDVPTTCRQ